MNSNELVDTIVREVKRVLAQRGIQVQSDSGAVPSVRSGQTAAAVPQVSRKAEPVVQSAGIGSTDLSGKQVITQKDLEAYKGQTITVSKKAVMTPLAKDYARDKKITVRRSEGPAAPREGSLSPTAAVFVALTIAPDFTGDGSVLKSILTAKRLGVKEISGGTYEANVKKVADTVVAGSAEFGVCLENTGMIAPIQANRNQRIRAVHCRETFDARAARVDIGANVIVLDSVSNPEAIISGFTGL